MQIEELEAALTRLPATSRQLVAHVVEFLARPADAVSSWEEATAHGRPTEAVLLPPLDTEVMPATWPENPFMNPYYFGAWADRTDIDDSTEFVRELRREQNRAA